MGKASKWIRNFLVGKKEKNNKKRDFANDVIIIESLPNSPNSILPLEKRRWSFSKSRSSRNDFVLRSLKSFDSIVNSEKLTKASLKYSENELQVGVTRPVVQDKQGLLEHSAATRIQASFRSYLARRALRALRALVKLQALVRGHLVRKRTTATLKCMHALISIQVRARVQRITFSDESQKFSHEKDLVLHKEVYNATDETIIGEKRVILNTKSFSGDRSQIKRIDPGLAHFSPRLPIHGQELNKRTQSSSSLSYINNPKAKITKQNVPAHFSGPLPKTKKLECDPWMPNYMANTESSRAKARSHSEPKQRPKKSVKQMSRRSASIERLDFNPDDLASSSSVTKNQNRWLTKLYQSAKPVAKESECDSTSITTNSSNNSKLMMPYEPHVDLY